MSVRSVQLLVASSLAASAAAVEVADGLSVGGYGAAFARAERHGMDHPRNTQAGLPGRRDEMEIDFSSEFNLSARYRHEDFTLRTDLFVFDEPQFGDNVLLEQAFIDWQATESLVVRAGRFRTDWLGWEGYHAPQLWRVNNSAVWAWQVGNHGAPPLTPYLSDGVGVRWVPTDQPFSAEAYVIEDLLGEGPGQQASDVSFGGCLVWKPKEIGRFELGVGIDPNSQDDGDGTASTGAIVDLNGDITALRSSGWFFAAEVQYHEHSDLHVGGRGFGDAIMGLAMAAYRIHPKVELSAMVDFVDRGVDVDDNEIMEYALAVLTKPREQVRLNAEVFFWDETAANADAYGAAAMLLVHLP